MPGDLMGSGTISGPQDHDHDRGHDDDDDDVGISPSPAGCLLEATWRGTKPVRLSGTNTACHSLYIQTHTLKMLILMFFLFRSIDRGFCLFKLCIVHADFPSGATRTFLEDGDTVIMSGYAVNVEHGYRVGFGDLIGTVLPAHKLFE
jgi:2-keto-4-pentenoate hydratase/2-oxohepta-3-ene-1,7-dioic acid hydratase in catechol pathway